MKSAGLFFFILLLFPCYAIAQQDSSYAEKILAQRKAKDREFRDDTIHSPLSSADRLTFSHLDYYDVDSAYRVTATFLRHKKPRKFKMKTTTEREPVYHIYGVLKFELKGASFALTVYQNKEISKREGMEKYLFLPFTDLTSGDGSYGGGRYIDLQITGGKTMIIDFNTCYSPYCAYGMGYSCPVPPVENFLPLRIEAGEKTFH